MFDSGVIHRAGVRRQVFDALTRFQTTGENGTLLKDASSVLAINAKCDNNNILPLTAATMKSFCYMRRKRNQSTNLQRQKD